MLPVFKTGIFGREARNITSFFNPDVAFINRMHNPTYHVGLDTNEALRVNRHVNRYLQSITNADKSLIYSDKEKLKSLLV